MEGFVQPGKATKCSSNSNGKSLKGGRQGSDMKVAMIQPK